jgi:hypothetical protein
LLNNVHLSFTLDKERNYMLLIKTIFISIFIILIFHGISSAQANPDKHEPVAKQVQVDGDNAPNKTTDNSKQAPELEIVAIRYEKSITVLIDLSQGINLDEMGLETEKKIPAPSGYTFLEVAFKINNIEIYNLEIDDIEITDPEGNKDIPTIFIDATWNAPYQAFMSRSFYHPSPEEAIPCTFVIMDKFRDKELVLSIAKYNLKHVIPRAFEFKKPANVLILTPDDQKNMSVPGDK